MGYYGAAAKGYKNYGGMRYTLWGWLTTKDVQRDKRGEFAQLNKLRRTCFVRIGSNRAVWIRPRTSKRGR